MGVVSTGRAGWLRWVALGSLLAIGIEYFAMRTHREEIQRANLPLLRIVRNSINYKHPWIYFLSHTLHHQVTSHLWMLVGAVIHWSYDAALGRELYVFTTIGFAAKCIFKNLFQGPRGFWVSEDVHAFYCGKGYSMPSGHSMMSLMVLLFLSHRLRSHYMLLFTVGFELLVFLNVLLIGTHTFMDVLVGWSFAIACTSTYLYLRSRIAFSRVSRVLSLVGLVLAALTLEMIDNQVLGAPDLPMRYKRNMMAACGYDEQTFTKRFHLNMHYANTVLVFSAGAGMLYSKLAIGDAYALMLDQRKTKWVLYGAAAVPAYLSYQLPSWVCSSGLAQDPQNLARLSHFVFPIYVLVLVPSLYVASHKCLSWIL